MKAILLVLFALSTLLSSLAQNSAGTAATVCVQQPRLVAPDQRTKAEFDLQQRVIADLKTNRDYRLILVSETQAATTSRPCKYSLRVSVQYNYLDPKPLDPNDIALKTGEKQGFALENRFVLTDSKGKILSEVTVSGDVSNRVVAELRRLEQMTSPETSRRQ